MIAKSFERIHRSNLVGMGIIPLCFKTGEDADTLGLTGHERYTIDLPSKVSELKPGQDVTVTTDSGKSFTCTARFDTEVYDMFLFLSLHLFFISCGQTSCPPLLYCLIPFMAFFNTCKKNSSRGGENVGVIYFGSCVFLSSTLYRQFMLNSFLYQ